MAATNSATASALRPSTLKFWKPSTSTQNSWGVLLAIAARGPSIIPGLLIDLQAAATDGGSLARDILSYYEQTDAALQEVAAVRKANPPARAAA
jgi:hypothetical protein